MLFVVTVVCRRLPLPSSARYYTAKHGEKQEKNASEKYAFPNLYMFFD